MFSVLDILYSTKEDGLLTLLFKISFKVVLGTADNSASRLGDMLLCFLHSSTILRLIASLKNMITCTSHALILAKNLLEYLRKSVNL